MGCKNEVNKREIIVTFDENNKYSINAIYGKSNLKFDNMDSNDIEEIKMKLRALLTRELNSDIQAHFKNIEFITQKETQYKEIDIIINQFSSLAWEYTIRLDSNTLTLPIIHYDMLFFDTSIYPSYTVGMVLTNTELNECIEKSHNKTDEVICKDASKNIRGVFSPCSQFFKSYLHGFDLMDNILKSDSLNKTGELLKAEVWSKCKLEGGFSTDENILLYRNSIYIDGDTSISRIFESKIYHKLISILDNKPYHMFTSIQKLSSRDDLDKMMQGISQK